MIQDLTISERIDRLSVAATVPIETGRVERERSLRFEAMRIATYLEPERAEEGAREVMAWVCEISPGNRDVRLQCLDVCWRPGTVKIADLLADAATLLTFVTEADDGQVV